LYLGFCLINSQAKKRIKGITSGKITLIYLKRAVSALFITYLTYKFALPYAVDSLRDRLQIKVTVHALST
jgi:hypothetical protein